MNIVPSIEMIPAKYGVGTLLCQEPMDGTGDLTVTRATISTRVNSLGYIETIPANTNLAWHSHSWIAANNWLNSAVTVVTGTSGTTDPFGTNLANAISPTSGSSSHIAQSNSPTTIAYTSGTIYTQSAFFKQGTGVAGRYVQMTFPGVGNSFTQLGYANFDLQLGTVAVVTGTSADTNRSASIENYGNGWYRCQFTATAAVSAGGAGVAAILITSSGSTRAFPFSGTTTDILYGFGAQIEVGASATAYIPTTTAAVTNSVPRLDYYMGDGTPGCPALLVEPAATNLLQRSEDFANGYWAKNYGVVTFGTTVSPDGTNDATTYVIDTGVGIDSAIERTFLSLATGTTHTLSLFVKKKDYDTASIRFYTDETPAFICSFDLSTATVTGGTIQNYGNGWYRVSVSGTTAATVTNPKVELIRAAQIRNSVAGIYIWGAQLETGPIATSYIPTVASTVTRNADVINKTSVSGLIGQTEGTIYVEVDVRTFPQVGSPVVGIVALNVGANNLQNAIILGVERQSGGTNRFYSLVQVSNATQAALFGSTLTNGIYKVALTYKQNDFAMYVNGASVATDNSGNVPTCSEVLIGTRFNTDTIFLNDRIRAAAIYKTRLPNYLLESATSQIQSYSALASSLSYSIV